MEVKYDVFISYSRADEDVARAICGFLESKGLRCFIDRRDIPKSANWARVLYDGIHSSGMMVAVFSDNYNRSQMVDNELAVAKKSGINVLPFRIEDVPFVGVKSLFLELANWLDAFPKPENVFDQLAREVQVLKNDTQNWTEGRQSMDIPVERRNSLDSDIEAASDDINYEYEDDYADGVDELRQHNYAEAFDLLLEPAFANYRNSQLYASWCTQQSCVANITHAAWQRVRAKAEAGSSFAEYLMSRYYYFIDHDDKLSFEYAARSAQQGNLFGLFDRAKCYDLGISVERDDSMGIDKIKELARLDFPPAIREVARQYIYGYGSSIKKNVRRGLRMLERGAELGFTECIYELGFVKLGGNGFPAEAEAGRLMMLRAKDEGLPMALANLPLAYFIDYDKWQHIDDPALIKKGNDLLMEGLRKNNADCFYIYADIRHGDYPKINEHADTASAIKWYKKAADFLSRSAMTKLGYIYYYGEGDIAEDEKLAWDYFTRARNFTDSEAEYRLGMMCMDGYAFDGQGKQDAVNYFENALFLGGSGAWYAVSKMTEIFAPRNFERGFPVKTIEFRDIDGFDRDEERTLSILERGIIFEVPDSFYLLGSALTDISRPYSDEVRGIELLKQALALPTPCYEAALRLHEVYDKGIGISGDAEYYLDIARQNLDKKVVDSYLEKRNNPERSPEPAKNYTSKLDKPGDKPVSAENEAEKKAYAAAAALVHDGATLDELNRAMNIIFPYDNSDDEKIKALLAQLRTLTLSMFRKEASRPRPQFRLLAQIMFAPILSNNISAESARLAIFEDEGAEQLKKSWGDFKFALSDAGLYTVPELSADLTANAITMAKVWLKIVASLKSRSIDMGNVSPFDIDGLLDFAQELFDKDSDSEPAALLVNFADAHFELTQAIGRALIHDKNS